MSNIIPLNIDDKYVDKNAVRIIIDVEENPCFKFGGGIATSNQEGLTGNLEFNMRNLFGYAEQFSGKISRGADFLSKAKTTKDFQLLVPYLFNIPGSFTLQYLNQMLDMTQERSINKLSHEVSLKYTTPNFKHSWYICSELKDYIPSTEDLNVNNKYIISPQLLKTIIPQLKNSFGYSYYNRIYLKILIYYYFIESFDDPSAPSSGSSVQYNTEMSGLRGSSYFMKRKLILHHYIPLVDSYYSPTWSLSFGLLLGYMNASINNGSIQTNQCNIDDLFCMGNETIRGFEYCGLGPRFNPITIRNKSDKESDNNDETKKSDYIGGNTAFGANVSLFIPIPWNITENTNARFRLYAQAGNVMNIKSLARNELNIMKQTMRYSAGIGITIPISILGSIEANYTFFTKKMKDDLCQKFQFSWMTEL